MATPTPCPLGDPATLALVRRKARLLEGQAGLTAQDLNDVEQDLLLAMLPRLACHDPGRSPLGAYLRLLLDHEADRLIRRRLAAKRRGGRPAAVDAVDPHRDARTGREPGRAEGDGDLVRDLARAIAQLPAELQDLVEAFGSSDTVAGAARILGRKRTTVHDQLTRLRDRFREAGLLSYLEFARHPADEPGTQSNSRPRGGRRTRRKK